MQYLGSVLSYMYVMGPMQMSISVDYVHCAICVLFRFPYLLLSRYTLQ